MSSEGAFWVLSNPSECARFVGALVPNIALEVSVPNQDCDGLAFPQLAHVARFEELFAEVCGGHAPPVAGASRYRPPGGMATSEYTIVLKAYLPEIVTDEIRNGLLEAVLAFGEETRQQVVLVAVGAFAFRFRFAAHSQQQEVNGVAQTTKVA